jgi:hypothetical protein
MTAPGWRRSAGLLDQALAHTFADPGDAVFSRDKEKYDAEWLGLARTNACRLLLEKPRSGRFYRTQRR